jgi:hypothetical protein
MWLKPNSLGALRAALTAALVVALGGREALAEPAPTPAPQTSAVEALPLPPDTDAPTAQSSKVAAPPTTDDERVPAPHQEPPSSSAPSSHVPASKERREPAEAAPRRWYGWQTLSTDAAAGALAYTYYLSNNVWTGGSGGPGWFVMSGATYLLGGPVVHVAHGKIGTGVGSLALRVGAPLVLGGVGYAVAGGPGQGGDNGWVAGLVGAIAGGMVGIVVAVTIDAAVLAYDHPPQPPTASPPRPQHAFAPTASVGPRWIAIGAAGSF